MNGGQIFLSLDPGEQHSGVCFRADQDFCFLYHYLSLFFFAFFSTLASSRARSTSGVIKILSCLIICFYYHFQWHLHGKKFLSDHVCFRADQDLVLSVVLYHHWSLVYVIIPSEIFIAQSSYHWVTRPKNFIETDTETFFETKIFDTETKTFFRDQIFLRPRPRLFFETNCFRDWYRDFFSRPNVFETDTETFFETKFFETDTETFLDQIFV